MQTSHKKLVQLLGTSSEALLDLDKKMTTVSGKTGVLDAVADNNDQNVDRVLADLGLTHASTAEEVYEALTQKLADIDKKLFELLDRPDLSKLSEDAGKIRDVAFQVFASTEGLPASRQGFFIKKGKVAELLAKHPPQLLLEHFGYQNTDELLQKEGFASTVAALRFTQTKEWMHSFFDVAYHDLKPEDFENRDVEIKILDTKWLAVAEKFIGKKLHNVSHLKEYGIIFISPDPIDQRGETLRMFLLLLHYLHEVPFYSNLFRKFLPNSDFVAKLQSLLRGDVPELSTKDSSHWMIIQRYLAKNNIHDPRLSMYHVSPEAEHWYRVAQNFQKLAEVINEKFPPARPASLGEAGEAGQPPADNINYWAGLDHVGDFFKNKEGVDTFVSFNVVDLVMSLVTQGETKYVYHQQEAMWNTIFVEYIGRDKMNTLIKENIIKGFVELQ